MSKRVITINRMLGSNGRLIGKALAEELGFAFYDKELRREFDTLTARLKSAKASRR